MKKKRRKENRVFLFSLSLAGILVILALTYLTTSALLTDKDEKQNAFKVGDLRAQIEETFDESLPLTVGEAREKEVWIKNTGEQDSLVRVLLLPTMEKDLGVSTLSLPASFTGEQPTLTFETNEDWLLGEDGYFYYLKTLSPGEKSSEVLKEVTVNPDHLSEDLKTDYDGAKLTIDVKVEAIGTTEWAYRDAFWQGNEPTQKNLQTVDQKWAEEVKK